MVRKEIKGDQGLSPEFVRNVLELVRDNPAALLIIDDLAAQGGKASQKQLSVSPKWARKLEDDLKRLGLIDVKIETVKGVRGVRKNFELTPLAQKISSKTRMRI